MSREVQVGSLVVDHFPIFENDGITKHSGLTSANFSFYVYKDSVPILLPVSIVEIGTSGEYEYSFTPATSGVYDIEIFVNYNLMWLGEQFIAQNFVLGSGSRLITIQLRDNVTPIQGGQIDVYDATNTVFLTRIWTAITGNVTVALDPGTYNLRIFAAGYTFTTPIVLPVTANATVTYLGNATVIVIPPSAPNLCVIFGSIFNAGGQPISNAHVRVWAVIPQTIQGVQEGDPIVCAVTDANGYFQLELQRLAYVNMTIETTGLDVVRQVPDLPSQNLVTWI